MSVLKLKIIDRLFVTELGKMMLGVTFIVSTILFSQRFVRYLSKVTGGELSSDAVLTLLSLNMVVLLIKIIPVAMLLSVLLVLGRMYRDQEMSAWFSAGVGLRQIYRSVFIFVIPVFLLTLFLSVVVMPKVTQKIEQVKANDQAAVDIRGISQGRFNEYSRGDLVFYVEKISDDDQMHRVFIQNRQHGKLGITTSETGRIQIDEKTGDKFIVLSDGHRYEGVPGQADYTITQFKEYGVVVAEKKDIATKFGVQELETATLMSRQSPRAISEWQRRLSIPLAMITFALLAVPISRVSPRAGMYGNLITALLIYIIFENLMSLSHSWIVKGTLSPWVGVWWVHLLTMTVAFYLIVKMHGWDYVKTRLRLQK